MSLALADDEISALLPVYDQLPLEPLSGAGVSPSVGAGSGWHRISPGEPVVVDAPLPPDMRYALEVLRIDAARGAGEAD